MGLKKELFPIITIAVMAFLVYLNSFNVPFIIDDYHVIQINENIRNASRINLLSQRSLLEYSFAINYYFSGLNPAGYHLGNIILHIICGILVYYIAYSIFMHVKKDSEKAMLISIFAALLFITHPLHIGTVTHLSSRSEGLMTTFYLASLLFFIKSTKSRKWAYLSLSFFMFVLAGLSKQTAVTLPLMIVLYDLCFGIERFSKQGLFKRFLSHYWPFFVAWIAGLIFIVKLNPFRILGGFFVEQQFFGSPYTHTITGFKAMIYYMKLIFIPVGYGVEYYVRIAHSLFEFKVLAALAFIIAILILGLLLYRKHSWMTFCIYWFFIGLLPSTTIMVLRDIVTDRWAYLPSIGPIILIAGVILGTPNIRIGKRKIPFQKISVILAIIILFAFIIAATHRNYIYGNEERLWKDTLEKNPSSFFALNNLGVYYLKQEKYDEAEKLFKTIVLRFNDTSSEARNNLGVINMKKENYDEALEQFTRALEISAPPLILAQVYTNLANFYMKLNQTEKVVENLEKARELNSN